MHHPRKSLKITLLALCGGAHFACSSETGSESQGGAEGPVYATMGNVYNLDDRTVYIALTDTVDLTALPLADAHEFPGVANCEAIGGDLYVSDGTQPVITRYGIGANLEWHKLGEVSFANFPLADNANFFYQYQLDEHTSYMPFDGYKRIVWDPTELVITDVLEDSAIPLEEDGMLLEAAGNRGNIHYDDAVMQPFFYHDDDWFEFAPHSPIAVYDPETHEETKVLDAPCPGLAVATRDESGNVYFSTYDYGPTLALYGLGPAPCVARVKPNHTLDDAFTTDMTAWTGGRYSTNFHYVRDGWGLADVLHDEEIDSDFSGGKVDPDVFDEIWLGGHWKVWRVDLLKQEAHPFEDVDVPGLGWSFGDVDGRTFLFVPYDEASRTRIYELDSVGHATPHLDVLGDAGWLKVR